MKQRRGILHISVRESMLLSVFKEQRPKITHPRYAYSNEDVVATS